jgi:hypothetical protein
MAKKSKKPRMTERSVADVLDEVCKVRQRAALLWAVRSWLFDQFVPSNGQPPLGRVTIDGRQLVPRRDVVDDMLSELLVTNMLVSEHADTLLAGRATIPEVPPAHIFEPPRK